MPGKNVNASKLSRLMALWNAVTMPSEAIARMFGHHNKVDRACGYPSTLTIEDYAKLFNRDGIARRAVSLLPDESWKLKPSVFETEDEDVKTPFEQAWAAIDDELGICDYMRRVDVLSGIGEFGLLILGFDSSDPLSVECTRAKKLLYLKAVDRSLIRIETREKDTSNSRFGQPVLYSINLQSQGDSDTVGEEIKVHWTRVIHVADNRMSSDVFGVPRLQAAYNRLHDLSKLLGGSAEMFWKGGFFGLALKPLEGVEWTDTSKDEAKDELHKYFEGLQRYLALEGVEPTPLSPQVADPANHFDIQIKALCIGLDVPYRTFMGTEKSELTSSEEKKTWNDRVSARCENYLTPRLIRPLVQRLIDVGVLPKPKDIRIVWPDRNSPSDKDVAEVARIRTEAFAKYVDSGAPALIGDKEYLTKVHMYDAEEATAMLEGAIDAEDALSTPEDDETPNAIEIIDEVTSAD